MTTPLPICTPTCITAQSSMASTPTLTTLQGTSFSSQGTTLYLPATLGISPGYPITFTGCSPRPLVRAIHQTGPRSALPTQQPSPLTDNEYFPTNTHYLTAPSTSRRLQFPSTTASLLHPIHTQRPMGGNTPSKRCLPSIHTTTTSRHKWHSNNKASPRKACLPTLTIQSSNR